MVLDVSGRAARARADHDGPTSIMRPTGAPRPRDVRRQGRSPGSRIDASAWPSRCMAPVTVLGSGSPLTVAGAASASPRWARPNSLLARDPRTARTLTAVRFHPGPEKSRPSALGRRSERHGARPAGPRHAGSWRAPAPRTPRTKAARSRTPAGCLPRNPRIRGGRSIQLPEEPPETRRRPGAGRFTMASPTLRSNSPSRNGF